MSWNADLMPNESSMSISSSQKSRPAWPSTSCVIIPQAGAPSGQNQMKGMLDRPCAFKASAIALSINVSTDLSTGQRGNGILSQPLRRTFCRCLRTPTPMNGRNW